MGRTRCRFGTTAVRRNVARLVAICVLASLGALAAPVSAHADDASGRAYRDTITIRGVRSARPAAVSSGANERAPASAPESSYVLDEEGCAVSVIAPEWTIPWTCVWVSWPVVPADLAVAAASEFQRVRLVGSGIEVQPGRGWTLVNVETIVFTDPGAQSFETSLLGMPVVIEASPIRYTWDFGDGSAPLVTADPGAPYPDHGVAHVYRRAGTRTISLTTEWTGRFRVADDASWMPISGTAVTTDQAPPIEVRQARNVLVLN